MDSPSTPASTRSPPSSRWSPPLTSTLLPHRAWGAIAAWAYLAAFARGRGPADACAGRPAAMALAWLTFAGAALLPLVVAGGAAGRRAYRPGAGGSAGRRAHGRAADRAPGRRTSGRTRSPRCRRASSCSGTARTSRGWRSSGCRGRWPATPGGRTPGSGSRSSTVAALAVGLALLRSADRPALVRGHAGGDRTADLCSDPGHRRRRPAGPGPLPAGPGLLRDRPVRRPPASRSARPPR